MRLQHAVHQTKRLHTFRIITIEVISLSNIYITSSCVIWTRSCTSRGCSGTTSPSMCLNSTGCSRCPGTVVFVKVTVNCCLNNRKLIRYTTQGAKKCWGAIRLAWLDKLYLGISQRCATAHPEKAFNRGWGMIICSWYQQLYNTCSVSVSRTWLSLYIYRIYLSPDTGGGQLPML